MPVLYSWAPLWWARLGTGPGTWNRPPSASGHCGCREMNGCFFSRSRLTANNMWQCGCFLTDFPVSINSVAAKRSPNATYETVGRHRYYQILVRLATQEFLLPKSMSDRPRWWCHVGHVVIKVWIFFFSIFLSRTTKKLCGPHNVPTGWSAGRPRIFISCSTA